MEPLFTSEEVLTSEQWSELGALLARFIGRDAVALLFDSMASPDGLAALATPATFMHDLDKQIGAVLEDRELPSDPEVAILVPRGVEAIRSVLARELVDPTSLGSPAGVAFLSYLEDLGLHVGAEVVVRTIADRELSTLWSFGTLHAMLSLMRICAATSEAPFEARARETARAIREASERWYKPLLQVTLRLDRLARGKPIGPLPRNLGVVMSNCVDAWKASGPTAVLLPPVRFIRNADGHADVDVDVAARTIRFTNRPDAGPAETLGPWTEEQLRASATDLLTACTVMSFAYARYFFEQLGSKLEQLPPPEGPPAP